MPRLSLCLIARDEEAFLPACLESVRDVVDEIVIVDTGSQDRTIELARQANATIVEFPWINDFSAARNAALGACTGDWILVLDADERLSPGSGPNLREAIQNKDLDCGLLPLVNASRLDATPEEVLSGKARHGEPILLPRLIRFTPDLCWKGVVHENIGAWMKSGKRRSARIDAPIIHLGYVDEIWIGRRKSRRNLDLLKQRCKDEPHNPWIWGLLAQQQIKDQTFDQARQSVSSGWMALEAEIASGNSTSSIIVLATTKAKLLFLAGQFRDALECLEQVGSWRVFHPNIGLLRGQALYHLSLDIEDTVKRSECLDQAVSSLSNCLNCSGKSYPQATINGATSWEAHNWMGLVELLLGRPENALHDFTAALDECPQHLSSQLGRAEALLDSGDMAGSMDRLQPLLQLAPADASILAAIVCEDLGHLKQMRAFMQTVADKTNQGLVSPHRAARMAQLHLACAFYQGKPQKGHGVIGRLYALERGVSIKPVAPIYVDWGVIRRLVRNLIRMNRPDMYNCMLTSGANDVLPGISSFVRQVIDASDLSVETNGTQ